MADPNPLPVIGEAERTPLVEWLLARIEQLFEEQRRQAEFVQQLRDAGFTGKFASADGTKDPEFVKQAGSSSKDAVLSCPCGPAGAAFSDEYTKKFGQDLGKRNKAAHIWSTRTINWHVPIS